MSYRFERGRVYRKYGKFLSACVIIDMKKCMYRGDYIELIRKDGGSYSAYQARCDE